jgi:uncharacterized protein involved in exopolysaccharide biosynthesis
VANELLTYLRIILKRWWLILLIMLATGAVILYQDLTAKPVYRAYVKLQVISPESQEVSLFGTTRSTGSQEEIVAVQGEFDTALRSSLVAWQTISDLNLGISAADLLNGLVVFADGDYIHATFTAENAMLVESIATAHVENAFEYYAQTRARSSTVALQFIEQQMAEEEKQMASASKSLLQFKIKHNLDALPREITAVQDQLRSLRMDRAKLVIEREKQQAIGSKYLEEASKTSSVESAANYSRLAAAQDATVAGIRVQETEYDKLIADQETYLVELLNLSTEYDGLTKTLSRIQSSYDFLTSKESEARLKQSQAQNVSFVQIVEPARMPDRPAASRTPRLLMIGGLVSIVSGVILAFVLEFLSSLRTPAKKEDF